jgi:pyruvate dehydrogenase E1 component alpha subunit
MTLQADRRREAYRRMLAIRAFEQALPRCIAAGEIPGAVHSSVGHEAALVGACMALRDDDYITGTHRSHGHPIAKGSKVDRLVTSRGKRSFLGESGRYDAGGKS